MEDYKIRLINERIEINEKIEALDAFLQEHEDGSNLNCPARLLSSQLDAMQRYSAILDERIKIEIPELT